MTAGAATRGGPRFRLAAISAHPDDDTYGSGGVVALEAGRIELTVVVATSGEAGQIAEGSDVSRADLAAVREREERDALTALGAEAPDVRFLRFPDGGLKDLERAELVSAVTGILAEARPHVVLAFGPEGITRHDDHITMHHVATTAFHAARERTVGDDPAAFARLLYNAVPRSALDRFFAALREAGADVGDPDDPFMPRVVPDDAISVTVDCSSVADRKLAAIRAHRTQMWEFDAIPEEARRSLLANEWFVQGWPPPEPGGPTLSGIFQGLDP